MAERAFGRREALRGLLLGAAGLALPAACGVPSGGPPLIDGPGPSAGVTGPDSVGAPPDPNDARSPVDLVTSYLAAAGPVDTSGAHPQIPDRVKKFLTDDAQRDMQLGTSIAVVRVHGTPTPVENPPDFTLVTIDLQQVGQLDEQGWVEPAVLPVTSCQFQVKTINRDENGGGQYRINQLPQGLGSQLLLSTEALGSKPYIMPVSIYFARLGGDRTVVPVVPDLRYLWLSGQDNKDYTAIVKYLLNGPPNWLQQAVAPLPNGVGLKGPFATRANDNAPLVVPLDTLPQSTDLHPLMAQLVWSLMPRYPGAVVLQSNSQTRLASKQGQYLDWNLADAPHRVPARVAEEYCVLGGAVQSLSGGSLPQVLNGAPAKVVSAALSRDTTLAALVHETAQHRRTLSIGQLIGDRGQYQPTGLTAAKMSRPVWLPGAQQALVLADTKLYAVKPDGSAQDISPNNGVIRAFAVSPEGGRIVLVTSAGPVLTSLTYTGTGEFAGLGSASVSVLSPFDCAELDPRTLTAVAWSRMEWVVLGGRLRDENSYSFVEVTVDGALVNTNLNAPRLGSPFTMLVGYPPLPSESPSTMGKIMGQLDTNPPYTFQYVNGQKETLTPPAPDPSASGAPPARLTAPFFLD
ncbi:MAG: hypothetical protein J2P15_16970 [Micromonosporaceae bacterium]|nr:hypothetical protein [Micromonosporaceae bacterium]